MRLGLLGFLGSSLWFGCAQEPATRAETICIQSCAARAKQCSRDQCRRGCNLSLDRLVEREGDNVIACVADAGPETGRHFWPIDETKLCDDAVWAFCAVTVGVHADGGPPPPPPPEE